MGNDNKNSIFEWSEKKGSLQARIAPWLAVMFQCALISLHTGKCPHIFY
jgi:hypothetical protein